MALIEDLVESGWLKTPEIISAFQKIKRVDFLPDEIKNLAELNEALPLGYGQTISQPLVVAFMIELLAPKPGEKILDIGFGSGWTSALLAEIVGWQGKVMAIEIVPELAEFGRKNIKKYNFIEKNIVECLCADGSKGYLQCAFRPELAKGFDKILASASVQGKIPKAWKEQLKIGGRIVAPIGNSIYLLVKKSKTEFSKIEHPGFVFVPLLENKI